MGKAKLNDNLNRRIAAWGNGRARSGANGLALALDCVERATTTPFDWTKMARLMAATGEGAERNRMKKILENASGMQIVEDASQPTGWRAKRVENANIGIGVLREYVERGVSFMSPKLQEGVDDVAALLPKPAPREAKLTTLTNLVERLLTEGKTEAEVMDAVAAGIVAAGEAMKKAA